MTTTRFLGVIVFAACLAALPRAAGAEPPSVKDVRAAIDAIERNPLGAVEAGHTSTVMAFAQESPDITILMDPELVPFISDPQNKHAALLQMAFIAGNIKGQLNSKKNKDDSYSGLQTVFKSYHAIQGAEKDYKVKSIDDLEALDKQGKLKAKVEEVQKRHDQ